MDKPKLPRTSLLDLGELRLMRPLADIPAVLKHFDKDGPGVRLSVVGMCLLPSLVKLAIFGTLFWLGWRLS